MRPLAVALAVAAALPAPARAFDAATTHAGLTEGAALASQLGRLLTDAYGRPLGLYEPLTIELDGERGLRVKARLAKLDAGQGYAPDRGRLPAIQWLVAGSVAEEVPAARERNHFFDPVTGRGLDQGGLLAGADLRLAGVSEGSGSLRGFFTGASFDGTGRAATAWLTADDNDFSLARFLDARERATTAAAPVERDNALADALLTAGALLHVVEDMADPAHVRNDYRVAMGERGGRLRRYAAERYGRVAVPPPAGPARPVAHLVDLIHDGAGGGLADRAARLFSDGTLPGPSSTPAVAAGPEPIGYVAAAGVPHLVRWRRARGDVRWDLDEACLADYAAAQLPAAGQGALSALAHLFRGGLAFRGGALVNGDVALGAGTVRLFAEDAAGKRRQIAERQLTATAADADLLEVPAGATGRLAALFRGVDGAGEPIVVAIESPK